MYISIDIGYRHLAYASFDGMSIEYDVFDIDCKKDITSNLYNVLTNICSKTHIDLVIIEKQVSINSKAREIEYSIRMFCKVNGLEYMIYNPKLKFSYLHPSYNSKRKEHKKISIEYARKILEAYLYNTGDLFDTYSKKDDISDCICMVVFVWLENHDQKDLIKRILLGTLIESH